jgi:hypothetical protein
MSTRTSLDLANAVLLDLNIVPAGQSAAADDIDWVQRKWAEMHALMLEKGLVDWDHNATPLAPFQACVDLVKARVAPQFGIPAPFSPDDPLAPPYATLRELIAPDSADEVIPGEFF